MGTWKRRFQLPEHRLLVWRCGQTPGSLKKSKESKSFRKKLTKRPLALRCQTQYTQAHDLGGITMRYLDCPEGSFLGKFDNSWKTTPLPSTLQLCRRGMTLLETLHHACVEKFSVLLSPSCGWAYAARAGTFVLAALVAMFPGINFVLLDSDCLPVTLFEVEDLWTEAYFARYPAHSESGIPKTHPLRAFERFRTDPRVVYTQHRVCSTRMGQGALVVTEPHSKLNAGLIVIFRSSHPPLFD